MAPPSFEDVLPLVWDFLSVRDLWNLRVLSKSWKSRLTSVDYTKCRDGNDYSVPFPGFPGLFVSSKHGLFPHQLASLQAMYHAEHRSREFGALRGGILADAPGLGKTVTVLALIASTAGMRPVAPPEFWDAEAIQQGWKWMRLNPAAKSQLLQCMKPLRRWSQQQPTTSQVTQAIAKTQQEVQPPYPDDRFQTFDELERYIFHSLRFLIPRSELELVRLNLQALKSSMDKKSRKIAKSLQSQRILWERQLVATSATLIVVPDALLEHWYQQIVQHLQLDQFADPLLQNTYEGTTSTVRGVVYLDGIGDAADLLEGHKTLKNLSLEQQGQQQLQPWDLSRYMIVLTSFSRCQHDMEIHRLRTSNCTRRGKRPRADERASIMEGQEMSASAALGSPLLRLRWLRLVVDEGHELGTHEVASEVALFIHIIAAERRWVLSGTPTTGDVDDAEYSSKALDQLQRLLIFLRHPQYGLSADQPVYTAKSSWDQNVKQPFLAQKPIGREALFTTLRDIMVMHKKEDIALPKPIFEQAQVDVQVPLFVEENALAQMNDSAMMNYLKQYLYTNTYQSLVDRSMANYILRAVELARDKLRQLGGPLPQQQLWQNMEAARHFHGESTGSFASTAEDRRRIKAVVYSSSRDDLLSVMDQIIRDFGLSRVAEMYESPRIGEISSELARFRNDERQVRVCPVCGQENDLTSSKVERCSATLIEVTAVGTHLRFLIEPERILRAINVPLSRLSEGETLASYPKLTKFWKLGDLLEVDIRRDHPLLPPRRSELEWELMGATTCRQLAHVDSYQGQDWYFGSLPEIQRQDTEDDTTRRLHESTIVTLEKWQSCARFHNPARWYTGPRLADAPIQKMSEEVSILGLDAGLSHGLDLSFVTHLFLLEPIEDAALLEQVTSRAHRLGATGPVTVVTIHPFFTVSSDRLRMALENVREQDNDGPSESRGEKKTEPQNALHQSRKTLTKSVCQYCFRQFLSRVQAETHETNHCPRNPHIRSGSTEDEFHLSSIYRQLKPPLPAWASPRQTE